MTEGFLVAWGIGVLVVFGVLPNLIRFLCHVNKHGSAWGGEAENTLDAGFSVAGLLGSVYVIAVLGHLLKTGIVR